MAEDATMPRGARDTRGARKAGDDGASARAWSVPLAVSEVSEAGRHLDLVADAQARAAVAKLAGLAGLPRLEASFDVTRRGRSGLHVVGRVSATVLQTCVVTLEPLENDVEEDIDIAFVPAAASSLDEHVGEVEVPLEDAPEPLVGGAIDLGAIATEFLVLGLDSYPRMPDAVLELPPSDEESAHPFAALAELKKGQGGK
jgi:uncharacterized metal-binding protein YceD (DUF177 family)